MFFIHLNFLGWEGGGSGGFMIEKKKLQWIMLVIGDTLLHDQAALA